MPTKPAASRNLCVVCNKDDHKKKGCPHKGNTCQLCGVEGHIRAACPNRFVLGVGGLGGNSFAEALKTNAVPLNMAAMWECSACRLWCRDPALKACSKCKTRWPKAAQEAAEARAKKQKEEKANPPPKLGDDPPPKGPMPPESKKLQGLHKRWTPNTDDEDDGFDDKVESEEDKKARVLIERLQKVLEMAK